MCICFFEHELESLEASGSEEERNTRQEWEMKK